MYAQSIDRLNIPPHFNHNRQQARRPLPRESDQPINGSPRRLHTSEGGEAINQGQRAGGSIDREMEAALALAAPLLALARDDGEEEDPVVVAAGEEAAAAAAATAVADGEPEEGAEEGLEEEAREGEEAGVDSHQLDRRALLRRRLRALEDGEVSRLI